MLLSFLDSVWAPPALAALTSASVLYALFKPRLMRLRNELAQAQAMQDMIKEQLERAEQNAVTERETQEQWQRQYQIQREQVQHLKTRLVEQEKQTQQYQGFWQQAQNTLAELQGSYQQLNAKYHALEATMEQKKVHFEKQLSLLEESKLLLKQEFENLANQLFEEKSQRFKTLNRESMEQLLKPVSGELKGFRDKIEAIHTEDLKQRAALKNELINLQNLNRSITEQADRLTNALQGQKKTQGNWGELMLENVLDSAGLRPGEDYRREVSFNTEDGRLRPDVVVYLPQNRHLVIDAKTSLSAYTRYVNADTEIEAQGAIREHVAAIAARIAELADRDYYRLPGLNSPEVVILFVPIESAYVEALRYQPDLYQNAIERNILVATPTTLLTSLNIVKQLWRFEDQSKHSAELALRAERFYTKLNTFLVTLTGVGKQLDKAKEGYDKALAQLYSGKGNLIKQASEFKELGVAVQKELPSELVERGQLELDHE